MNAAGVLTTTEELEERDYKSYRYIDQEGEYILHLDFRAWWKNRYSLACYFSDDAGNHYRLHAWRKLDAHGNEYYGPKETEIDMEEAEEDSWWMCTIQKNSKNRLEWKDAKMITA